MKHSYLKLISGVLLPCLVLVLTTTNAAAKNPDKSNQASKTTEWYMRLTVEEHTELLKDRGNVLGHLKDSQPGYDSHDLLELDPFTAPYLTLVFAHPDWEAHAGNYSSDYHPPSLNQADQWLFQVKTDDSTSLISRMWLEDLLTGEKIDAVIDGYTRKPSVNGEIFILLKNF